MYLFWVGLNEYDKYGCFIVICYGLDPDQKYDRTMTQKMESCVKTVGDCVMDLVSVWFDNCSVTLRV